MHATLRLLGLCTVASASLLACPAPAVAKDAALELRSADAAVSQTRRQAPRLESWSKIEREAARSRKRLDALSRSLSGAKSGDNSTLTRALIALREHADELARLEREAKRRAAEERKAAASASAEAASDKAEEERDAAEGGDTLEDILEEAEETIETIAGLFGVSL